MTETKKEAFRKYLEGAGVIDAMTKVLVALYEEPDKPKQAIDFMKKELGGPTPQEHEELKAQNEALSRELAEAQEKIAELEAQLNELQNAGEAEAAE